MTLANVAVVFEESKRYRMERVKDRWKKVSDEGKRNVSLRWRRVSFSYQSPITKPHRYDDNPSAISFSPGDATSSKVTSMNDALRITLI
jgi:hypothetical protein